MSAAQSPELMQFRVERMRRAPRNWCFWVAAFTAVNGILVGVQSDMTILAGFVVPYLIGGVGPHLAVAIILAVIGYFGQTKRPLYLIALVAYALDAMLAGILQLWAGLFMHVVILVFVAIALNGARLLQKQLAQTVQQPVQPDRLMAINLSPSKMYGHWTHCEPKVCEFQHGSTMIYVNYSDKKPMESRLAVAQATIEAAFKETENALEFARQISENKNPEFWRNARRIPLKQSPLIVFAVRYPLDGDLPVYEISWDSTFGPESGVALSEDWMEEQVVVQLPENDDIIYLQRVGVQRYAQIA